MEGRHFAYAEQQGRQTPAVAGNYVAVAIDQDRDVKLEGLYAFGDLPDLLLVVTPRIAGSGLSSPTGRKTTFNQLISPALASLGEFP